MLPDWVSNPGPLTYESGALLIALRGPAGAELYRKTGNIITLLTKIRGCFEISVFEISE